MSEETLARRPIVEVAAELGLPADLLEPYGRYKAKIDPRAREAAPPGPGGRLILVSAINPTPAGEGKTTVSIGLSQGIRRLGKKVCVCLREPSLGPVFGVKGGGTGGGRSQLFPMEDINLHFNGDIHAVGAAHNLLAALVDNAIYFRDKLDLDHRRITWRRVMDMNDRALRKMVVGLGGRTFGVPREDSFDITAASEVMAVLCLSSDLADLKARLGRILVGYTHAGAPVTAADLGAVGSMAVLLRDAMKPNLVQTSEGGPAIVHGGPFGNIAHGCNSIIATRMGLAWSDYVVTEAGFGFDLGAEKFFDIKCRVAGLWPNAVVLVVTLRALRVHGGASADEAAQPHPVALRNGIANLEKHIESVRLFGFDPIVAINVRADDPPGELSYLDVELQARGMTTVRADVYGQGGVGAERLAAAVLEACERKKPDPRYVYALDDSVEEKILRVARDIYGARGVEYTVSARRDLGEIRKLGYDKLPICIAKTQTSLSDDARVVGRPSDFAITVREVRTAAGAGFLVPITGEILTMPGLPRDPAAARIDLAADGTIMGLK